MKKFKVGDLVKVNDGSSSVRLDDIHGDRHIGISENNFEVMKTDVTDFVIHETGGRCHDIIIKENGNGNGLYLHSSRYLSPVEPQRFNCTFEFKGTQDQIDRIKDIMNEGEL